MESIFVNITALNKRDRSAQRFLKLPKNLSIESLEENRVETQHSISHNLLKVSINTDNFKDSTTPRVLLTKLKKNPFPTHNNLL